MLNWNINNNTNSCTFCKANFIQNSQCCRILKELVILLSANSLFSALLLLSLARTLPMFGDTHNDWPLYNCLSSPVLVGPHPKPAAHQATVFSFSFVPPFRQHGDVASKKGDKSAFLLLQKRGSFRQKAALSSFSHIAVKPFSL